MANEDQDVDLNNDEAETEVEETEAPEEKPKAERPKRSPEEELDYFEARAARLRKKLGRDEETPAPSKPRSTELDYGQKAYLTASLGIKGSAEWALVREYTSAGKTIDDLIDNRHFNNDLKDIREAQASKDAIPSSSKRSTQSASNQVEYWIAKGGLPENTPANTELRNKIVAERLRQATDGSKFTAKDPIVQ